MNWFAWYGFIVGFLGTGVVVCYILPLQTKELKRPKDGLTRLRWMLWIILFLTVVVAIPALSYQLLRATGTDLPWLRNVATIFGSLVRPLNAILLVLVWRYKYKDE